MKRVKKKNRTLMKGVFLFMFVFVFCFVVTHSGKLWLMKTVKGESDLLIENCSEAEVRVKRYRCFVERFLFILFFWLLHPCFYSKEQYRISCVMCRINVNIKID